MSATRVRTRQPPAVGGLLSLVTRGLFRFEDLGLGPSGHSALSIGASHACDIVIDDPFVSSIHAAVTFHQGVLRMVDIASHNGTFEIVHRRAQWIHSVALALGQRFVLGQTTLVCVTEDGHAPLTAFDVTELASLTYERRATRPAEHRPPRKPTAARWWSIRGKVK